MSRLFQNHELIILKWDVAYVNTGCYTRFYPTSANNHLQIKLPVRVYPHFHSGLANRHFSIIKHLATVYARILFHFPQKTNIILLKPTGFCIDNHDGDIVFTCLFNNNSSSMPGVFNWWRMEIKTEQGRNKRLSGRYGPLGIMHCRINIMYQLIKLILERGSADDN